MTILFDVSGQLRTLVWSNNLLMRMKRQTSRTTRYPTCTTTSILPRWVCGKDNCGRALSNESVAKTTVAERCPDESVANATLRDRMASPRNATVLDWMAKYAAWHEMCTSSLNTARCRSARLQNSHHIHSKLFQALDSNLEPFAHKTGALPSRCLPTYT